MTGEWAQVRWTEARQVVALQGVEPADLPPEGVAPQTHYRELRDAGRRDEAVAFLGVALPRLAAIAWAGRIVEAEATAAKVVGTDRQALDYALRWIGAPIEDHRVAAKDAADAAGERSPERLLALAAYFSGGSISQPDFQPVLPPPDAAGKLAAGAILIAAHRGPAATAVLDRALDLGEKVAEQGLGALTDS